MTVRAGLDCKANTIIYALKVDAPTKPVLLGIPAAARGSLVLSNSEDLGAGRVKLTLPAEQFPDFTPNAVCFVTVSIVQPLIVPLGEAEVEALDPRAN